MVRLAGLQVFVAVVLIALTSAAEAAERRLALVIGNSDYAHTQKLDNPAPEESAFEEDEIVDALPGENGDDVDQSFIEELDNTLSREIKRDQLKA